MRTHKKQRGIGGAKSYKLPKIKFGAHGLGGAKHGIGSAKGYKVPKIRLPKIRLDY